MHGMRFDQTYMPGMEFGSKPELYARHEMWVKLRFHAGHGV